MANVTITLDQYSAFVKIAREGATTPDRVRAIDRFVADIDRANAITRHGLWVQWQEANSPLPVGTVFPTSWPPELRSWIERTDRAIAKADVLAVLARLATSPVEVLVTRDPGAELGWTPYLTYFGG